MSTKQDKETIYLPLEGVDSEHCAVIVDKGLEQVEGIDSHRVELNNYRAAITLKDSGALPDAVKAVKSLGYGVTTVKKTFPVLGMSCASCASSAESVVQYEPGVVSASVNYGTGNLVV